MLYVREKKKVVCEGEKASVDLDAAMNISMRGVCSEHLLRTSSL
jgi:hypothetical protein